MKTALECILEKKIRHQRRELRRLARIVREKRWETFGKKWLTRADEMDAARRAMTNVLGDEPWNAGMHHGMKLARSIISADVAPEVVQKLSREIAWRFAWRFEAGPKP